MSSFGCSQWPDYEYIYINNKVAVVYTRLIAAAQNEGGCGMGQAVGRYDASLSLQGERLGGNAAGTREYVEYV